MKKDKFWKNKNVLITGIHGFLGSNLCKMLIKNDANVYGIHNNNSNKSLLKFENINEYNSLSISLNDSNGLKALINDNNLEICFHLAAQVEVQKAIEFPFDTLHNNINSTLNLLEAFKNNKRLKSFIFCSTDKVYGDIEKSLLPYKEEYVPKPRYPYEVSKLICEKLVQTYDNNFNFNTLTTRSCNLYGPGQLNLSAIIPSLIVSALGKNNFEPRSNGMLLRDYMFIEDWCETLLSISKKIYFKKPKYKVYNFGTNSPFTVKEITKLIYDKISKGKTNKILLMFDKHESKNEIPYQTLDSNRAISEFKFNPKHTITGGMSKTIKWFKKYSDNIQ